jgi:hypothetical protein
VGVTVYKLGLANVELGPVPPRSTSGNVLADLNDDVTTTYAWRAGTDGPDMMAFFQLAGLVLPPNTRILWVRPVIEVEFEVSAHRQQNVAVLMGAFDGISELNPNYGGNVWNYHDEFVGGAVSAGNAHPGRADSDGSFVPWDAETINAMSLQLILYNSSWQAAQETAGVFVRELWLEVAVDLRPTVSALSPSGTISTTRPWVSWAYADVDDDPQQSYQIQVFRSADQFGGLGFDGAVPVFDTGEVFNSLARVAQVTAPLDNDVPYTARVRATQPIAGEDPYWSDWSRTDFMIQLPRPAAPSLMLTPDVRHGRMKIEITRGAGTPVASYVRLERSDEGLAWEVVQAAGSLQFPDDSGRITAWDYDVVAGRNHYRAIAIAASGGHWVDGAPSSAAFGDCFLQSYFLRDASFPSSENGNLAVRVTKAPFTRREAQGRYEPLDNGVFLVLSGGNRGAQGRLEIMVLNETEKAAVDSLLTRKRTLRVDSPLSDHFYLRVGEERNWEQVLAQKELHSQRPVRSAYSITVDWVEVVRPTENLNRFDYGDIAPDVTTAPQTSLTANPSSMNPGSATTLHGVGFAPYEHVTLVINRGPALSPSGVNANSAGEFSVSVTVSASTSAGAAEITAIGDASGLFGQAAINVVAAAPPAAATLQASTPRAPLGQSFQLYAYNFQGNEQIVFTCTNGGNVVPNSTTASGGSASATVHLEGGSLGGRVITATGVTSGRTAQATFYVDPAPGGGGGTPPSTQRIYIVNHSTRYSQAQYNQLAADTQEYVNSIVVPRWGAYRRSVIPIELVFGTPPADGWWYEIVDGGGGGYHTTGNAVPRARLSVWGLANESQPRDANNVYYEDSTIFAHEVIEMLVNPGIPGDDPDGWRTDPQIGNWSVHTDGTGRRAFMEACDPVNSVGVAYGQSWLADFILPSWFGLAAGPPFSFSNWHQEYPGAPVLATNILQAFQPDCFGFWYPEDTPGSLHFSTAESRTC